MNKTFSFILFFFFSIPLKSQIIIRNSNDVSIDAQNPVNKSSVELENSSFKTTSRAVDAQFPTLKLYALREDLKVSLSLILENGATPSKIIIERKTSNQLSEFRSIREFSEEELSTLAQKGKLIFEDKFPEPRKLNCYFRIMSQYDNGVVKYTVPILLLGQTINGDKVLMFGDHKEDISLFIDETITVFKSNLRLLIDRKDGGVIMTLVGGGVYDNTYLINIERLAAEKMPIYRTIKQLNQEELEALFGIGLLSFDDKYPSSSQYASFYRIVVSLDGQVIELTEPIELPRLK
jgi:hypothetical protein